MVPGMGGAMDLVVGSKRVIVAMEHTAKGQAKLMSQCSFPLTAVEQVNLIVTEMGVFEITEQGMVMTEIAPEFSFDDVQAVTGARLIRSPSLKTMTV